MDYRFITVLELPVGYGKTTKAIEHLVNEAMDNATDLEFELINYMRMFPSYFDDMEISNIEVDIDDLEN